jgi:hypothetical protein
MRVAVGLGLESASPWVQRFCVNKGAAVEEYHRAAALLREHGIATHMNITLGSAFLAPSEAIDDAEASVRWALDHGADLVVLFPVNVRPHTLLAELYRLQRFRPPSLWSLHEVLFRLGPELCERVQISWYKNYYDTTSKIVALPTTCAECLPRVMSLLDSFRDDWTFRAVEELGGVECSCREAWRETLDPPARPLPQRVTENYAALASTLGLGREWQRVERATARAMAETPTAFPP